jgi:O-antigen ligase
MRGGAALAASPALEPQAASAAPYRIDALRIAVAAIMLFSLGRLHEYIPFLGLLRPALLATLVAIGYALLQPGALVRAPLLRTWPAKVIVALALMACISAPFGLSLGGSFAYVLNVYSRVIVFAFLLIAATRDYRDLRFFIWTYLVGTAAMCYVGIFVLDVVEMAGSAVARLSQETGMYDANDMGVLLTLSIPLCVLMYQTSRWKGKIFCILVLLMGAVTIALTGSRGGFLGFLGVGLALLASVKRMSVVKRVAIVVVAATTLAFAAPAGYWQQMKSMADQNDYNYNSEDGRLKIWGRGVGYMLRYPLTGVGIANFGRAEGTISEKARYRDPGVGVLFAAAHNSFVQVGAELGLPGLGLYCTLVIGGFVSMRRLRRRLSASWSTGAPDERFLYLMTVYLPITFIGFAITASFVSFAYTAPIYVLAAFVSATLTAVRLHQRRPGDVTAPVAWRSRR